ncbi:Ada metal-binding domain-containing protein [Runella sp.]|uniref:Ada metal-binding domain-containing protein n=1 Tax=Runella sp. TaxID=1960881 RepID=UPI003D0E23DB
MLSTLIKNGEIRLGGNRALKIYGKLTCSSGKRLKIENRVFFKNAGEALQHGYRPCGHCMRQEYKVWKREAAIYARGCEQPLCRF